ncbi:MAG: putative oxidoreductase [Chloroflexota bacterium]|nr:putative oxidoreductase [Chloroflexota bacterium]
MSLSLGLLVLRLVLGLTMAGHGAQKLFGWWGGPGLKAWTEGVAKMRIRPAVPFAWLAALAELGGGLLLALGFLSPLGSLAIIGTMLVAIATVHWPNGFWNAKRGYEFNLSIIAGVVAIGLAGAGSYSVDQAIGFRMPEPATFLIGVIVVILGVAGMLAFRSPKPAVQPKPQAT